MKMKKKMIFASLFVIASIGAVVGFNSSDKTPQEDGALMENVEALSDGEDNDVDCRYINGYSIFTTEGGGAYDCCRNWRYNRPNEESHCH